MSDKPRPWPNNAADARDRSAEAACEGARILEPGYDRLIAIGDTTWKNYEVTTTVTVWGIDSTASAFDAANGGPGLGFLLRWKGHTSTPVFSPPISQPLSGYTPSGAICR